MFLTHAFSTPIIVRSDLLLIPNMWLTFCFITCSSTASSKGWWIPRVSISYFDVIISTTFTNFMNIESLEFKLNIMANRSGDHPDTVCIWRVKAWIPRADQSSIWFDNISTAHCIKQPDLLACVLVILFVIYLIKLRSVVQITVTAVDCEQPPYFSLPCYRPSNYRLQCKMIAFLYDVSFIWTPGIGWFSFESQ